MEVLGIDIGGSGIKGAIVDITKGELITERHRIPTPQPATPKEVSKVVAELAKYFEWKGKIGCGFPAAVVNGVVKTASNIARSWIDKNIINYLKVATGCEVNIVNDADAAGLAELEFGAGRDRYGVIIIVTVGTGLGTSIFSNRTLLPNTELGHLMMNGLAAEHYASDAVRKDENLSWKKWAKRFNKYLHELDRLFWPELIIIGGGASKKHDRFFEYLNTNAEIEPAQLRNEAGIIGAALSTKLI